MITVTRFCFSLDDLIKAGKVEARWIGVKNGRKALKNKKLVEFLQAYSFENERFKLPNESVTLFPLFLVGIIGSDNDFSSEEWVSARFHLKLADGCLVCEVDAVQGAEGDLNVQNSKALQFRTIKQFSIKTNKKRVIFFEFHCERQLQRVESFEAVPHNELNGIADDV
nr:hypothetical protein [Archaeoglobus neptunius]